jgi:hypothetical protein
MKPYMFRTVSLSIIRSLFTVHSAVVYDIQVCRTAFEQGRWARWPWAKAVYKPVWHIPLLSVRWINSWWWTEKLSETCRVSCQNKFVKLVHLVGFIIKKFVTMHGHTNVKFVCCIVVNLLCLKRRCIQFSWCSDGTPHSNFNVIVMPHTQVLVLHLLPTNISPGIQQQGLEDGHWSTPNAKVKNEWSSASSPPYAYIACTGTT